MAGGASVLEPGAGAGGSPLENNPLSLFFSDAGEGDREVLAGGGASPPVNSVVSLGGEVPMLSDLSAFAIKPGSATSGTFSGVSAKIIALVLSANRRSPMS